MAMTAVVLAGRRGRCHNVENLREGIRRKLVEIGRWYCAAFGGAPHQSSSGSEEPLDDSFSPRGEAFVPYRSGFVLLDSVEAAPKASPSREKLSENRLFGTDFLTDVGVRRRRRSMHLRCPTTFGKFVHPKVFDIAHRSTPTFVHRGGYDP